MGEIDNNGLFDGIVRDHQDIDGNPCTLDTLCRKEPSWAANRIRVMKKALEDIRELASDREAFVMQGPRAFARAVQIVNKVFDE